ncbi:MAG TPA: FMN-binding protein [Pseudonocardiaceae bacterium]|nr:FMN-binding protein [Pseudonocardiaceae bacterium]
MRRAVLAIVVTVVGLVLLLSFKTHDTSTALTAPPAVLDPSSAGMPSTSAGGAPSKSSGTSTTKTVTGDSADTRYGPVQVRITVSGGKLTAVDAVVYPTESPRDVQINSYAIPQLNQEALAARSAQIDMISGATYTSQGYITSLQSALDKANG